MGTKQQPARPPHGVAVKQSPLTARARRLETTAFPRSDLWSWTDDGAKDELIESMLRECVPPMAVPSTPALNGTAPLALAGNNRPLLVSQSQKLVTASQHSHLQLPMSSQTSRKTRNLQSPPTSLPPPPSLLRRRRPGRMDGKHLKSLIGAISSKKNENDGEDQHSHADGNAGTSGDEADPNEKEEETEEMRIAAAAAAKLMEAKAKFQREVLDEDTSQGSSTNGVGDVQNGAEDFWRLYKNSTTSKRPDSTRGRFIANCQNSSLLVLPVLDLKRPSRYEQASQALCYDNYYFGDKRAEALGDALQLLPLPIQTLSMKNVGVSGSGSSAIMSGIAMKQLKHLIFSENRLGTKGILTIYRMLENPQINLKSLDLGNNQLGDQAVRTLIQCLLNRCTLEHLDLRCNHIFHAAVSIGELLRITTPLASLNLSWNNIRGEPAQHLARCMMENLTLTHLDLSDNTLGSNGKAAADLGACLATNKSLRFLDISNNHVQAKSMLVYVNGLQQNTVLESLIIRGNPIGVIGGEAVLRSVASGSISNCQIDIGDCNLEILDGNLEGTIYGGGTFNLNLTERSDSILLRELLQLVWKNKTDIVDSLHNGAVFTFNRKDEKALMTSIPSQGSMHIKIQPNYDRREEQISPDGFDRVVTLIDRSFGHSQDGDEAAKLFCIRTLAEEYSFTVAEANTLLSLFESCTSQVEKANAAAMLIPQILQTPSVQGKDVPVENYDCASMKYRINFSRTKTEMEKLTCVAIFYGLQVQPLQGGFRNMRLNRLPIVMGNNWQFPRLGILEFDFVMTRRPYAICTALNDGAFEQFLKEFKQLQVPTEMKIIGLRSISTLYYFTCSQAQRIMEHFGTFERDPTTGCLFRGEVFIVLFSRIVDEWNLSETLSLLDLTTKTQGEDLSFFLSTAKEKSDEAEAVSAPQRTLPGPRRSPEQQATQARHHHGDTQQLEKDAGFMDKYSRQIGAFGLETMAKLVKLKVLIVGLQGVGIECAKNLILAGPGSITLHDDGIAEIKDLGTNFFLTEQDLGQPRASSVSHKLAELNKMQSPQIGFIMCDIRGAFGYAFTDFGDEFKGFDATGEAPITRIITDITNDKDGVLSILGPDEDGKMHEMPDSDHDGWIEISDVQGMKLKSDPDQSINTLGPRRIKFANKKVFRNGKQTEVFDAYRLKIGDTSEFTPYEGGGVFTQHKKPFTVNFKSLEESLVSPVPEGEFGLMFTDGAKFGRAEQLHVIMWSLMEFEERHGHYPEPHNDEDADEVVAIAKEGIQHLSDFTREGAHKQEVMKLEELDEKIVRQAALYSAVELHPLAAFYGGVIAQEVVKLTGKFTPLKQWLHLDAFEVLPDERPTDAKPIGSRYDHMITTFGLSFQKQLGNVRTFLVGCGALGMNSDLKVKTLEQLVAPHTENVFNDEFWTDLDVVTNALDNVKARLYVDSKCVFHKLPLMESGTLGTKCNVQVVIPYKTQSYADGPKDAEGDGIPMCTLRNFPSLIEHCIEWSRAQFEDLFVVPSTEAKKFVENRAAYLDQVKKATLENPNPKLVSAAIVQELERLRSLRATLQTAKEITFEKCVTLAFELMTSQFRDRILQLIHNFPEDHLTNSGEKFWSGAKRFPQAVDKFDPENPLHLNFDQDMNFHIDFIYAASNLRAFNYRIRDASRHKCKMIAGKIIPAIATTTASVTGLAMLEMLKLMQRKDLEAFKDSSNSLGLNMYLMQEPAAPARAKDEYDVVEMSEVKCKPPGFTKWDSTLIEISSDSTLEDFLAQFKEKTELNCDLLFHSVAEMGNTSAAEKDLRYRTVSGLMLYDRNAFGKALKSFMPIR
ncbi:Ubiquitin-activating enzyme E1, Cys active site [Phytophthora cactorum]|nr:Ubiquitin-activating enzyme E1, Cys active site [Phytophthora cactorum]